MDSGLDKTETRKSMFLFVLHKIYNSQLGKSVPESTAVLIHQAGQACNFYIILTTLAITMLLLFIHQELHLCILI